VATEAGLDQFRAGQSWRTPTEEFGSRRAAEDCTNGRKTALQCTAVSMNGRPS
jgi:hypothetical protein